MFAHSKYDLTLADYALLRQMKAVIDGQPLPEASDAQYSAVLCRSIALEAQNVALWEHIDGMTKAFNESEDRAGRWRSRWAKCLGVILAEVALAVVWMIAHYGL